MEIIEADPDGYPRLAEPLCLIDCDRPEQDPPPQGGFANETLLARPDWDRAIMSRKYFSATDDLVGSNLIVYE